MSERRPGSPRMPTFESRIAHALERQAHALEHLVRIQAAILCHVRQLPDDDSDQVTIDDMARRLRKSTDALESAVKATPNPPNKET